MKRRVSTSIQRLAGNPWPIKPTTPSGADRNDRPPAQAVVATLPTLVTAELRAHAPFTMLGALTGVAIMASLILIDVPRSVSATLFWSLHPLHVLLSALATTAVFTLHSRRNLLGTVLIGYIGSVGIATLSDCVIPFRPILTDEATRVSYD